MPAAFETLELFYEALGARLDALPTAEREAYLARLALLLANEIESGDVLMKALEDAR